MSAVTARVSNDLRSRIVAVLREDRDVHNIGALADQLEAAIRNVDPVAWLRPGEETPVQNVPFGAMWISDKDDPRAFPVYDRPQQPVPSVAVKAGEAAEKLQRTLDAASPNHKTMWVYVDDLRAALSAREQDVAETEALAALKEAEPYVEICHSLLTQKETRANAWRVLKQVRAAIAAAPAKQEGK